jgi:hypothetical protein
MALLWPWSCHNNVQTVGLIILAQIFGQFHERPMEDPGGVFVGCVDLSQLNENDNRRAENGLALIKGPSRPQKSFPDSIVSHVVKYP